MDMTVDDMCSQLGMQNAHARYIGVKLTMHCREYGLPPPKSHQPKVLAPSKKQLDKHGGSTSSTSAVSAAGGIEVVSASAAGAKPAKFPKHKPPKPKSKHKRQKSALDSDSDSDTSAVDPSDATVRGGSTRLMSH